MLPKVWLGLNHFFNTFFFLFDRYAIPDTPLSIAASIRPEELTTLVNTLLQETGDFLKHVDFDFLVSGEFLK